MLVIPMAASIAKFIMPMPPPKYPPYTATISSKTHAPVNAALLASREMSARMRPVKCFPNAKSSVAPSINHGKTRRNVCAGVRSEEHTSELQSRLHLVCRLLLEKKKIEDLYSITNNDQPR